MAVSILNACLSRQDFLDITLPHLLAQEGVEFEICLAVGPTITLPNDPRIVPIPIPPPHNRFDINKTYNILLNVAKHDILFITQCDIDIRQPDFLKKHLALLTPNNFITEQFYTNPVRDDMNYVARDRGLHLQCCTVHKKHIAHIGGWHEPYSSPDMIGHEDADIIASLLEMGLDIVHTQSNVKHLYHKVSYWDNGMVEYTRKIKNARALFDSRHKLTPKKILEQRNNTNLPKPN